MLVVMLLLYLYLCKESVLEATNQLSFLLSSTLFLLSQWLLDFPTKAGIAGECLCSQHLGGRTWRTAANSRPVLSAQRVLGEPEPHRKTLKVKQNPNPSSNPSSPPLKPTKIFGLNLLLFCCLAQAWMNVFAHRWWVMFVLCPVHSWK